MTERCYDFGYSDWCLAIKYKRLAHVASHGDYWRDPTELYAWEAGPLWKF